MFYIERSMITWVIDSLTLRMSHLTGLFSSMYIRVSWVCPDPILVIAVRSLRFNSWLVYKSLKLEINLCSEFMLSSFCMIRCDSLCKCFDTFYDVRWFFCGNKVSLTTASLLRLTFSGLICSSERELLLREQNVIAGMIGELLLYELQLYKLFVYRRAQINRVLLYLL